MLCGRRAHCESRRILDIGWISTLVNGKLSSEFVEGYLTSEAPNSVFMRPTWLLRFPKKDDMIHALHLPRTEHICGGSHT